MDTSQDFQNLTVERIQQAMQNQNSLIHIPISTQMSHLIKSQNDSQQNFMKKLSSNNINMFHNDDVRNSLQLFQNFNRNFPEGFNELVTQDFTTYPAFNERLINTVPDNTMESMMFPVPFQIKSEVEDDQQYYESNQEYVHGLPAHMSIDNETNQPNLQTDSMYVNFNSQMSNLNQQHLSSIDIYARQQTLAPNFDTNNENHPQNLVINRQKVKIPVKEKENPENAEFDKILHNEHDVSIANNNKTSDDLVYKNLIVAECANIKGEFNCYKCNESFTSKRSLRQHAKVCNKDDEINNEIDINKSNDKGKFCCVLCAYRCNSPAILSIHERTHTGEKPFSCKFCGYKSTQKNNVAKHLLTHMKEKPFHCQFCDYKCAQKNNLVVHERTHTGYKPFACTYCDYKTVQKPNLVKHMYLHTDEKPFSCDICNYKCVQKTNLTKHKQRHTAEKFSVNAKSRSRKVSKEVLNESVPDMLVVMKQTQITKINTLPVTQE